MKLTSMVARSGCSAKSRRIEIADIGLLDGNDIVAAAQPRMQLAAADIDRIDAPRAALEQHFGEAAGRGADIEADAAGDIDAETHRAPPRA